jgi:hypothetical protein
VTATTEANSDNKAGAAVCDVSGPDMTAAAISGGASVFGQTGGVVAIVETRPTGLAGEVPAGWTARAVEVGPNDGAWTLTVYAVCANVAG